MGAARGMTKEEHFLNRTTTIRLALNIIERPFSDQLHINCTTRVCNIRKQLIVCYDGDGALLGKVVSYVRVDLFELVCLFKAEYSLPSHSMPCHLRRTHHHGHRSSQAFVDPYWLVQKHRGDFVQLDHIAHLERP